MNNGLGFEIVQIMYHIDSVDDLDSAMAIVNDAYRILRGQLEVLEEVRR